MSTNRTRKFVTQSVTRKSYRFKSKRSGKRCNVEECLFSSTKTQKALEIQGSARLEPSDSFGFALTADWRECSGTAGREPTEKPEANASGGCVRSVCSAVILRLRITFCSFLSTAYR